MADKTLNKVQLNIKWKKDASSSLPALLPAETTAYVATTLSSKPSGWPTGYYTDPGGNNPAPLTYTNGTYYLATTKTDGSGYTTENLATTLGKVVRYLSDATTHYGTCDTAAATAEKAVTCSGFNLVTGAQIAVRFTVTNTAAVADLKLNVNGTGAKSIKYRNANLGNAGYLAVNRTYMFVYDGTYYQLMGDIDTNSNDAVKQNATTTNATYEVLFSYSANNTTETNQARKNSNLTFNPSTGNLTVTQLNGVTVGSSPKFTDNNTTYTFAEGTTNGAFSVTPSGGSEKSVPIHGLGSAAYKAVGSVASGNPGLVTGGDVWTAIDNLPEPMVFKGSLGTGGTITALPVNGTATVGDTYKVITAGTYDSKSAKVGDTFICDSKTSSANTWTLIPSGDEPSGTVTSVGSGDGLTGGAITSSGTLKANLKDYTKPTVAALALTNPTANTKFYPVSLDKDGKLAVSVPWTDNNTDTKVTQTVTTSNATYEVLFSVTASSDNTTKTEGARKNNNLTFNPSTGNLTATQLNGVTIGTPVFTDTTYTLSGAANSNNQFVVTLTPSSGSATTATVPVAGTGGYGITKLSSSTSSTSEALAATPKAVKAAYDLAASKTANTGTVTGVTAGDGLTGGTISTSGTIAVSFGTSNPAANGTASPGSATTVSRSDHVHPLQTTVSGNAGSATKLKDARTIDGVSFNGSAAIIHYGTCDTAAATAAKTVACTGFTLVTGAWIAVKFTVTNTAAVANLTLSVNSTTAKGIKYRNADLSSAGVLAANRTYIFVYDGTYYQLIGDLDTNSDTKVTQTATTTSANYEVLFSSTADNTTRTEGARKNSNLTFNPNTGTLATTAVTVTTPAISTNSTKVPSTAWVRTEALCPSYDNLTINCI